MKILAIVRVNLIRSSRDRSALFFSVLLPLMLILVLGLTYGAQATARVGLLDADGGPMATQLVTALEATPDLRVEIRRYDSLDGLRDAAARGIVQVGIAVPAGYSSDLASGRTTTVTIVAPPTGSASAVETTVDQAISAQATLVRAARLAAATAATSGTSFDASLQDARSLAASVPGVAVAVEPVNAATGRNGYDVGAQGQLILFMFLTSLTGAIELVLTRQLGISRRMFATPTGLWTIIFGESAARIAFAVLQGVFIVAASAILFGVRWGDPAAVAAIVLAFALVSGGAAMLVGSLASNPSQAGALGPALGLLFGLLGGAMVPAEVFPDTMRTLSHLTPHAWAVDALRSLGEPGTGVPTVAPQLAVLAAFAAVLFGISMVRLRQVLRSGA
jgi:ABC-2 type transport system permease protein